MFRLAPVPVLPPSLVPVVVLRYARQPPDGRLNARAVTICLWHEITLVLVVPLIDRFRDVPAFEAYPCCCAGGLEDVAARRKPRLLPGGRTARMGP
ncbi:hypothetical protein STAFG_4702 [Streptomyces afghaniensis 772]|uniref:Uncharacterized protein n=1 Tax=Streptomyces afghaniensis 772 TaxID=1283301 RepID=S4MRT6_9ACTN|nr:hypothetical protein STAFG_4702 [Streptomyces afghaniensis 772]